MALWLVITVIAVAAIVLVATATWLLGYPLRGFERLRASGTEAGERTADMAADFLDWVRLGR